jgi:hypothetical protein
MERKMKSLFAKKSTVRATALQVMQAALIVAVAVISGVIAVVWAEVMLAIVFWCLALAFKMAVGFTLGYSLVAAVQKIGDWIWPVREAEIKRWFDLDLDEGEYRTSH